MSPRGVWSHHGAVLLGQGVSRAVVCGQQSDDREETCRWYERRFRVETFFSDQKSRGFHLHKSHMSNPQRLSRLLIAACFAYIWIIFLGSLCEKDGWREHMHRKKRCDLSLFQLGAMPGHFLNKELPITVFHVAISSRKNVWWWIRAYRLPATYRPGAASRANYTGTPAYMMRPRSTSISASFTAVGPDRAPEYTGRALYVGPDQLSHHSPILMLRPPGLL